MKFLCLLLFLPLFSFAQDPLTLKLEDLDPSSEEVLITKPEKHLRHESMIYNLNTDLGIKDQRQFTGTDYNRFSGAFHTSGDYEHLTELQGFELNYMRRTQNYNRIWWGAQAFQHNTRFNAISQNHTLNAGDNANADSRFRRDGNSKNNILGMGLGVGYRFKLILDFFQTEDMFESIDVFVNSLTVKDDKVERNYRGYGLSTNYGLHYRSSTSFFYGGKISYNLGSVTRSSIGNESKGDRSLALGWLSAAFEIGIFF